jgi:hypothetical protein
MNNASATQIESRWQLKFRIERVCLVQLWCSNPDNFPVHPKFFLRSILKDWLLWLFDLIIFGPSDDANSSKFTDWSSGNDYQPMSNVLHYLIVREFRTNYRPVLKITKTAIRKYFKQRSNWLMSMSTSENLKFNLSLAVTDKYGRSDEQLDRLTVKV